MIVRIGDSPDTGHYLAMLYDVIDHQIFRADNWSCAEGISDSVAGGYYRDTDLPDVTDPCSAFGHECRGRSTLSW